MTTERAARRTTTVAEHQRQLDATSWPGTKELAAKWGVSRDVVLAIPRVRLPYLLFGETNMRRYDPADVTAYEQTYKYDRSSEDAA